MPYLPDINTSSVLNNDAQQQIDDIIRQLNEWGRLISNESQTKIVKSDAGVEAITFGSLPDGLNGILIRDEDGVKRGLFGQDPNGDIVIAISKEGEDVIEALNG